MTFIIQGVADRPDDLAGVANGRIPDSLTRSVHPDGRDASGDADRLHHLSARKWAALVHYAAKVFELELSYTGAGRSYARQEALFRERYVRESKPGQRPEGCSPGTRKTWDGSGWWRRAGVATAAVPGTSNHGWGGAVDMSVGWIRRKPSDRYRTYERALTTAEAQRLTPLVLACGWSWEMQSEPWHIRDVTGDHIPAAVLAFEAPPLIVQEDTDMMILDSQPGQPAWVRLVSTGTHLAHVVDGLYSNVLDRALPSQAPVVVSRDELLSTIRSTVIKPGQPCPWPWRDDGEIVLRWVEAGGGEPKDPNA